MNVGRVDLGFLNRIIIDDVCIYDQQKKKMLPESQILKAFGLETVRFTQQHLDFLQVA